MFLVVVVVVVVAPVEDFDLAQWTVIAGRSFRQKIANLGIG